MNDNKTAPSATASIRIRPGVDFFRVAAHVASQVASATGVPKQFVEVRDARTHRSWQFDPDTGSGAGMSDFLALQKSRSDEKTKKAQSALDVVFPGGTLVMVNVELDNKWEKRREVLRSPDPVVKSDRTSEETSQSGIVRDGASGTGDGQESIATRGTQSTSKNKTRDRTFDTNNGELESGKLAPDIKRITSAILIDANNPDLAGQRDAVLNAFKGIIGWDPNRGDPEPEILQAPFPEPEEFVAPPGPHVMDIVREWGPTAGQIIGVILVLLFLRGMLKRTAPAKNTAKRQAAVEVEEDLAPEEAARRIRQEIEKTISDDPAAISRLLESWLSEQKA